MGSFVRLIFKGTASSKQDLKKQYRQVVIWARDRTGIWGRIVSMSVAGIGSAKMSVSGKGRNLVFRDGIPCKDEQGGKSILRHQIFLAKYKEAEKSMKNK